MDTQNQGTGNSRHKTVELGCAAVYMSPNFAHTIGRITGYLRFVPKRIFLIFRICSPIAPFALSISSRSGSPGFEQIY